MTRRQFSQFETWNRRVMMKTTGRQDQFHDNKTEYMIKARNERNKHPSFYFCCDAFSSAIFALLFARSRFDSSSCHSPSRFVRLQTRVFISFISTHESDECAYSGAIPPGKSFVKYSWFSASSAVILWDGSNVSSRSARSRAQADIHLFMRNRISVQRPQCAKRTHFLNECRK